MNRKSASLALALAGLLVGMTGAHAQTQGVTKDEVVFGFPSDRTGPVAQVMVAVERGVKMAQDEINDKGGVHGRKIKILIEDNGYDAKKGMLVTEKLVAQDKVFSIILAAGTTPAAAAMPMVLKAGLPHACPTTAALQFSQPFERLSYACYPSNAGMIEAGVKYFMEKQGKKRVCYIYQDDGMGEEVRGALDKQLATGGLKVVESAGFKAGSTDYSPQVARVQGANCDLLVLGSTVPPAAAIMKEVQRRGWKVTVLGAAPTYDDSLLQLGKDAVNGMFAVAFIPTPNEQSANPRIKDWAKRYQAKFNAAPTASSVYGYMFINVIGEGLRLAGPNLTVDAFIKGMDSIKDFKTIFGATFSFSPTDHLGARGALLFQVDNGQFKEIAM